MAHDWAKSGNNVGTPYPKRFNFHRFILVRQKLNCQFWQRWSPRGRPWPRGHILKSLALASRPQILENWPVLGLRPALFFELLKLCKALEKFFGKRFFVEIA